MAIPFTKHHSVTTKTFAGLLLFAGIMLFGCGDTPATATPQDTPTPTNTPRPTATVTNTPQPTWTLSPDVASGHYSTPTPFPVSIKPTQPPAKIVPGSFGGNIDVRLLGWSADGQSLVSVNKSGVLTFATSDGKVNSNTVTVGSPVQALAWSPKGSSLAVGTSTGVLIYDGPDHALVQTLTGGNITALAWSPDNLKIAGTGPSAGLTIWNATNGQVNKKADNKNNANGLSWSTDGALIAISADTNVIFYNPNTAFLIKTLPYPAAINSLSFAPGSELLAIATADNKVSFYDASNGTTKATISSPANYLAWSSKGTLATLDQTGATISRWDNNGAPQGKMTAQGAQVFAWAPAEDRLFIGANFPTDPLYFLPTSNFK